MSKGFVLVLWTIFLGISFMVVPLGCVKGQQQEVLVFSAVESLSVDNDFFIKEYEWMYEGSRWTAELSIAKSLYGTYKRVSISDRTSRGIGGYDFLVTTQDEKVIEIADVLRDAAIEKGYESYDEVSFILAFIQSLPYTVDSVTSGYDEYPRFPLETLVDDGGDCEDTSILFATILLILDYNVVFISPPEHLAVGVWGEELARYYYTYNDKKYYFCETTGEGFRIGDIPEEYLESSVTIYSINQNSQYDPSRINFVDSLEPFWESYTFRVFVLLSGLGIIALWKFRKRQKAVVPQEPESSTGKLVNKT